MNMMLFWILVLNGKSSLNIEPSIVILYNRQTVQSVNPSLITLNARKVETSRPKIGFPSC